MSITPRRASELISMMELLEDTVEYFCDEFIFGDYKDKNKINL